MVRAYLYRIPFFNCSWANTGIDSLFDTILSAVIQKREAIEAERQARVRDSILLHVHSSVPEEDEPTKETPQRNAWSCC